MEEAYEKMIKILVIVSVSINPPESSKKTKSHEKKRDMKTQNVESNIATWIKSSRNTCDNAYLFTL